MKIILILIIGIFITCTAYVIYKLISREIKNISKNQINECKSEEEVYIALNNLKRKNIKKVIIIALVFYIGLPIIFFPVYW
ncbi:MAG: hypothetical protein K6G00_11015 [Treponema sp.]|nr:hypothetical protein [Treponema sp.]